MNLRNDAINLSSVHCLLIANEAVATLHRGSLLQAGFQRSWRADRRTSSRTSTPHMPAAPCGHPRAWLGAEQGWLRQALRPIGRREAERRPGRTDAVRRRSRAVGDLRLAGRLTRRVFLGRVDRRVEITNGLCADQQGVTEVRPVGEVDLHLAQLIADA